MPAKSTHGDEVASRTLREGDPSITAPLRGELQPEPAPPGDEAHLSIPTLGAGETLVVETCNSSYRLVVLDPLEHRILIRGGRCFARATEAVLLGSAVGRKVLVGRISLGRGLAVAVGNRCFVTSPVKGIEREEKAQPSESTPQSVALCAR